VSSLENTICPNMEGLWTWVGLQGRSAGFPGQPGGARRAQAAQQTRRVRLREPTACADGLPRVPDVTLQPEAYGLW